MFSYQKRHKCTIFNIRVAQNSDHFVFMTYKKSKREFEYRISSYSITEWCGLLSY